MKLSTKAQNLDILKNLDYVNLKYLNFLDIL